MERRKKYDKEFKLEAVRYYEESNKSRKEIEQKLGITSGCLSHWKRELSDLGKVWVTDITYIKSISHWLYLCVFLDLYSRKVVGWSVSKNPDTQLVLAALNMACERECPGSGFAYTLG